MGTSVQELKHTAKLKEWSARIAECRTSGKGVKAWCAEQDISLKTYYNWEWQIIKAATRQYEFPGPVQAGELIRINPDAMPNDDIEGIGSAITIRHGESVITLPGGSSVETIAGLVKALNRHV